MIYYKYSYNYILQYSLHDVENAVKSELEFVQLASCQYGVYAYSIQIY